MSEEQASGFAKYLIERFQGEVYGEAVFAAMADADPDPEARYKWRVLEALERETKEYLERALRDRGHSVEESQELRAQGDKLGRSAERSAPADGLAIARHVTAHERAILEFADREIAGRTADSPGPVLALLSSPPAPPQR